MIRIINRAAEDFQGVRGTGNATFVLCNLKGVDGRSATALPLATGNP